jgi:transposase
MDHLGLIAGMVDELGIVDVIDDAISQDHEKRYLSIGQTIKALIINGLGFTGRPMYLTPQFFATKPTELLIGEGVKAEHLNENTIGRAMDSLYKHGVSTLFSLISSRAFNALKLQPQFAHLDSTSFSVHGNGYEPSDKFIMTDDKGNETRPSVIEITQGYSKDHRPDLSQLMLNMIVENHAGIPMAIEALSGNSSDKATFAQTVSKYTSMISTQTTQSTVIADSALYSKENLAILKQSKLHWITRVPETMTESKEAIENTQLKDMTQYSSDERYKYKTMESTYGDVAQNWVVVYSTEARERTIKTLSRRYTKLSDSEHIQMSKLEKERFSCEAEALKATLKLTKSLKLTTMQTKITPLAKYSKAGRPAKGEKPQIIEYAITCTSRFSSLERYQQELHKGSCFILASNNRTKSPEEIMEGYQNQYKVERGFAFLKSKEFLTDAIFLKSPERIEALLMIMALCLMVYTALEYRIRNELQNHKETFRDQKGKPTVKPTARWVFQCFEGIQYLLIHELNKSLILNLNDDQKRIISLLGKHYEKIYFLGDGV